MIKIQQDNFNIDEEISNIKNSLPGVGSVSTFIGYVRNINENKKVNSIELEVYKDMAYHSLKKILKKALQKWNLIDSLVIHRYGKLKIGEKIVLVVTFSKHRHDSQKACEFIMDYLKKDSPFWKKENYDDGYRWLKNTS
jgi:molybdopterin synthase catalytic subunit